MSAIPTATYAQPRPRSDTIIQRTNPTLTREIPSRLTLDKMINHDLGQRAPLAETNEFLDKLLPVNETDVGRVFTELCVKMNSEPPLYDNAIKHWEGFSQPFRKEKNMYQPFVRIATSILQACETLKIERKTADTYWPKAVDSAPDTMTPRTTPKIRPDIVAALGDKTARAALEAYEQELKELDEQITEMGKKGKTEKESDEQQRSKKDMTEREEKEKALVCAIVTSQELIFSFV